MLYAPALRIRKSIFASARASPASATEAISAISALIWEISRVGNFSRNSAARLWDFSIFLSTSTSDEQYAPRCIHNSLPIPPVEPLMATFLPERAVVFDFIKVFMFIFFTSFKVSIAYYFK
jgi:hypothetical protein